MSFTTLAMSQNNVTLRFLSIGGDGFSVMNGFELNYEKEIGKGFGVRMGYSQASKTIRLDDSSFIGRVDLIRENFLGEKNTSSNPVVHYNQYHAYSIGASKVINGTAKSFISMYVGGRYDALNALTLASSGPTPESIKSANKFDSGLSLELELSYNYKITEVVAMQAAFYYTNRLLVFAGSLGVTVSF